MNVLDLFSGTGDFSRAFETGQHAILRVDNHPRFAYWCPFTIDKDVNEYVNEVSEGQFDVIVGSPPCIEFSTITHSSRKRHNLPPPNPWSAAGMGLVQTALNIIMKVRPRLWVIENVGGSVKYISLLLGAPRTSYAGRYLWSNCALEPIYGEPKAYSKVLGSGTGVGRPGRMAGLSFAYSSLMRSRIPFPISDAVKRTAEKLL